MDIVLKVHLEFTGSLEKKYRKAEYVQRRVCFVNEQSLDPSPI